MKILLLLTLLTSILSAKPNILLIVADDCTYNDLALYGGKNAITPNIDQLAKDGLVFNHAYLASAMCQPSRAELYTGLYPVSNGCSYNHSACKKGTKSIVHHLGDQGYRVGITGKIHVKPQASFPFTVVPGFDPSSGRNPTKPHQLNDVSTFFQEEKPFCLVVGLVEPHVPWVMGDPSKYPTQKLKLPPNFADTPKTREDFASYLAEVSYMDSQIGDLLETLETSGKKEDTLILFTSEQGAQFPGYKWTSWNTGVHTALIASWPNHITPATRTDALVQYTDILPTLIDLAGGNPQGFDGTSFAAVLHGEKQTHRQYVYAVHNQTPEGSPYPIRAISDGQYRYLENLRHEDLFIQKHLMGLIGGSAIHNAYWPTWMADSENPATYAAIKRYMIRPPAALYHTAKDPYEMNNLIDHPDQKKRIQQLKAQLSQWMKSENDPGVDMDTAEAHQAAKKLNHQY